MDNFTIWKSLKIEYPFPHFVIPFIFHIKKRAPQSSQIQLSLDKVLARLKKEEKLTIVTPEKEPIDAGKTVNEIIDDITPSKEGSIIPTEKESKPVKTEASPDSGSDIQKTNWLPVFAGIGCLSLFYWLGYSGMA